VAEVSLAVIASMRRRHGLAASAVKATVHLP
jgi:hypothetical protein